MNVQDTDAVKMGVRNKVMVAVAILLIIFLVLLKQVSTIWVEKVAERMSLSKEQATWTITKAEPTRPSGPASPAGVELPSYDVKVFKRHFRTRFPTYRKYFKEAGAAFGIDWQLLAAQAYQESHWNRKAKSPTGVRGIMMLTKRTAASLGVRNRLDPVQSINGGAKYLARLHGRLPDPILHPDRTFMALAAYNVGLGHVKDARTLARRQDKNPNQWNELRTVLPLLGKKRYYKTLRYGYARGHEPVTYVKRIRAYRRLLERHS